MNTTTNDYGMFSESGNSAVEAIITSVMKIADLLAYEVTSNAIFHDIAMPMLETLENVPAFEEAGDTAVREAVWAKLEELGYV